jgi:hypothetical protein
MRYRLEWFYMKKDLTMWSRKITYESNLQEGFCA